MPIPKTIFRKLSALRLSPYEWACLMVVLSKTYGEERRIAKLKIEDFTGHTNIKPPHIIRALSNLEERNVIRREKLDRFKTKYWLQQDSSKWRSILSIQLPKGVTKEHEEAFRKWFSRYPGPQIYKEDCRALYMTIISNGHKPSDINDALTGYGNLKRAFALTANKKLTQFNYMYPTNFLKKWQDFLVYKNGKAIAKLLDPEKYVGERE